MKNTGIIRRLDNLGRVVIPKELRKVRGIKEGDFLEIYVDDDVICLKPIPKNQCKLCGLTEHLTKVGVNYICHSCRCEIDNSCNEE